MQLGRQVDSNTLGTETADEKKAAIKGLRSVLKAGDLAYDKELLKKAIKLAPRLYEIAGAGPFSIHVLNKVALVRQQSGWITLRQALLDSGIVALKRTAQPSPLASATTAAPGGGLLRGQSDFDRSLLDATEQRLREATEDLAAAQFQSTQRGDANANANANAGRVQLNVSSATDRLLERQNEQLEKQLLAAKLEADEARSKADGKSDELHAMALELDRALNAKEQLEQQLQGEKENTHAQASRLEDDAHKRITDAKRSTRADGASREASLCDKIDEMQYFADMQAADFRDQKDRLVEAEVQARLKRAEADWAARMQQFHQQKDRDIAALHARISELLTTTSRTAETHAHLQSANDRVARLEEELRRAQAARQAAEDETAEARRMTQEIRTRPDKSKILLESTITELKTEIQRLQREGTDAAKAGNARLERELENARLLHEQQLKEAWADKERTETRLRDEMEKLRSQLASDYERQLERERQRCSDAEARLLETQRELSRKAPDSEILALQQKLNDAEAALMEQKSLAREAQANALQANTAEYEKRLQDLRDKKDAQRVRGTEIQAELEERLRQEFARERSELEADAEELARASKVNEENLKRELEREKNHAIHKRREVIAELDQQALVLADAQGSLLQFATKQSRAENAHREEQEKHIMTAIELENAKQTAEEKAAHVEQLTAEKLQQEQALNREKAALELATAEELSALRRAHGGTEEDLRRAIAELERRGQASVEQLLEAKRHAEELLREHERVLEDAAKAAALREQRLRDEFNKKMAARDAEHETDEGILRDQMRDRLKVQEESGNSRDALLQADIRQALDDAQEVRRKMQAEQDAARLAAANHQKVLDQSAADARATLRKEKEGCDRRLREQEDEWAELERGLRKEAAGQARTLQSDLDDRQKQLEEKVAEIARVKAEMRDQIEAVRSHGTDALVAAQGKLQTQLMELNATAAKEVEAAERNLEEFKLEATSKENELMAQLDRKQAAIDDLENEKEAAHGTARTARENSVSSLSRVTELQKELARMRVLQTDALDDAEKDYQLSLETQGSKHAEELARLRAALEAANDLSEEQATEIERLKTRILELEARIAELETENKMHLEQIEHMAEKDASQADLAWKAAEAAARLAEAQAESDATAPFRTDLCNWINGMCSPSEPLEQKTMLRQLADGVLLVQLAGVIDKEEVALRRVDKLEGKAAWSKKGRFDAEDELAALKETRRRSGSMPAAALHALLDHSGFDSAEHGLDASNHSRRSTASSLATTPATPAEMNRDRMSLHVSAMGKLSGSAGRTSPGRSTSVSIPRYTSPKGSRSPGTPRRRNSSVVRSPVPGLNYMPPDATANLKKRISSRVIATPVVRDGRPGSAAARLNIIAFLEWAEALGLADPGAFEVDDLFLYQNQKAVVFGLFDVARRCRTAVPKFISFERSLYRPRNRTNVSEDDPVDKAVADILKDCSCSPRLELTRIAPMKYMMANDKKPLLMSCPVPGQVLCRVGGGYEPLRTFLEKRDRCRRDKHAIYIKQCYANLIERLRHDAEIGPIDRGHLAVFTNRTLSAPRRRTDANLSQASHASNASFSSTGSTSPGSSPLRRRKRASNPDIPTYSAEYWASP